MNIEEKSEVSIKRYAFRIPVVFFIVKAILLLLACSVIFWYQDVGLDFTTISLSDSLIANLLFWFTALFDKRINKACSDSERYYINTIKIFSVFSVVMSVLSLIYLSACVAWNNVLFRWGNPNDGALETGIFGLVFGFSLVVSARIWVCILEKEKAAIQWKHRAENVVKQLQLPEEK